MHIPEQQILYKVVNKGEQSMYVGRWPMTTKQNARQALDYCHTLAKSPVQGGGGVQAGENSGTPKIWCLVYSFGIHSKYTKTFFGIPTGTQNHSLGHT